MSRAVRTLSWFARPEARLGVLLLATQFALLTAALVLGAHEPFFSSSSAVRGGQGYDFFCVPKAFANLLVGRSAFDTWGAPMYGPHATWFVLHPAVAIWVGGYLWFLPAWLAYSVWVAVTVCLVMGSASLMARHAASSWRKLAVFGVLLGSPVTYRLLFAGNVHALLLLAVALLLVGLSELSTGSRPVLSVPPASKVAVGLLLSLFSKPVLLLVVPALLLVRSSRRVALASMAIYGAVSLAFVVTPLLNPESVGIERLGWLGAHPEWIRRELNVYEHRFVLVPEMLDNAMHWMHMVAQSGYLWDHVEVFSLPVMLKGVVPSGSLSLVALLPVALSLSLFRLRTEERKLEATSWIVLAALSSHFLGYAMAWEYQYTQLLVAGAALVALPVFANRRPRWITFALLPLLLLLLPTPSFLFDDDGLSRAELVLVRAFRVLPALMLAVASIGVVVARAFEREQPGDNERS